MAITCNISKLVEIFEVELHTTGKLSNCHWHLSIVCFPIVEREKEKEREQCINVFKKVKRSMRPNETKHFKMLSCL